MIHCRYKKTLSFLYIVLGNDPYGICIMIKIDWIKYIRARVSMLGIHYIVWEFEGRDRSQWGISNKRYRYIGTAGTPPTWKFTVVRWLDKWV